MAGESNRKAGVRILFGIVSGLLAVSMLLYLVPQGPSSAETSTDVVASERRVMRTRGAPASLARGKRSGF